MQKYTFEQAKGNVAKVEKSAASLQTLIHATAIAFLKHWHDNPKAGPEVAEQLNLLQAASPYHARAFSVWLGATVEVTDAKGETSMVRLVPLRYSEENKNWYVHNEDVIKGKQFVAARDNTFWEISPPPAPKPLNDMAILENFFAKCAKHTKEPVDGDVIHLDMVKELRAVYLKHKVA